MVTWYVASAGAWPSRPWVAPVRRDGRGIATTAIAEAELRAGGQAPVHPAATDYAKRTRKQLIAGVQKSTGGENKTSRFVGIAVGRSSE